jgi:hypothetical protein
VAAISHLIEWRQSQKDFAGRLAGVAMGDDMDDLSDFEHDDD